MDTLASWATVMLGYDVHYGGTSMLETEDYHGEDDDDFDPDAWEPDFIVSLLCSADSSGAEDDKYDPEKRREYWNWYLDMVLSVYEKPQQEVIPFNHDTIHIPVPHGCDLALSDKIDRLNSALASYIHVPTNRKEIDRMKTYAEESLLVRIVADVVRGYSCIPVTHSYDVIRFWYCVALLAQSPDEQATDCLSGLARTLMEHGPGELGILYRILLLLPEQEHLQGLTGELAAYYQSIIPDLEAAKWLAKAGIPYPDSFEWSVSFRFTSNGDPFFVSENEADKNKWFSLSVELFGPSALYGDYTRFTSYQIRVYNADKFIHGLWNEKHGYLLHDNQYLMKDEHYTPEYLVALMYRLSDFGIRFSKVPVDVYASKGISGKAVKEWIRDAMEAYEQDCMAEVRDQALDLYRDEGDVGDSLNEVRKKWGEDIPELKESRFDEVAMQYSCFSHEMGLAALGQELTAYGYALFDLNGDDIYQLALIPQEEMQAFEEKCRKYGQYCKLLKQARYDFGMKARAIKQRKQMPRERMEWPDDGNRYITRGFAGYFAYGEWKPKGVEKWQGSFVADLRTTPLVPVRQCKTRIENLVYSEELDFYAALNYSPWSELAIGGKNPLEADNWPRLSCLSVESEHEFCWRGRYLCMGDTHSASIFTMSSRGLKYESRLIFTDSMNYPPSFGIDGKGMPYVLPGEFSRSEVYRYEGNGKYYSMPFSMSGYDRFSSGCIPVPETSRLLLLGDYTARSSNGIWMDSGLLDLNMATQECRIAPLRMGDGSFRLREFYKEWVLVESCSNGNRTDYARLWNRKTDEVLRLRPGVLGDEHFVSLHAMPDGTVFVNTLDKAGDVVCRVEDFWNFVRTASRPKKLGYWLNYPEPYPVREYELPPLSEDVSLMLAPPFVEVPQGNPPAARIHTAGNNGNTRVKNTDSERCDGIEITDGVLTMMGHSVDLPLSYTAMVRIFGKEKAVFTHRTMQDDRGKTVQYDKRGFLVWDHAGVTAVRNEENAYNMAAIYLWVGKKRTSEGNFPVPTGVFGGDIVVDGTKWDRQSDITVRSGELEVTASQSCGYMEITLAGSRDRKDTWQHYRHAMAEHLQAALMERDRVRLLERNLPIGKSLDRQSLADVCRSFLEHTVLALDAGYSMGRSVRYLKSSLMLPLTEAALKCSELGLVKPSDMLFVFSGCVVLGYEKVNMKRFGDKLTGHGVRDFVYDSLIRCIVPEWELSDSTAFPEIKEWLIAQKENGSATDTRTICKELACISANMLIADALSVISNHLKQTKNRL